MQTGILYDIDYTHRDDCLSVIDITQEEMTQIKAWTKKIELVEWQYTLVDVAQIEQEIPVPIVEEIEEIDEEIDDEEEQQEE